uniref:Uncharacterized protein n=1 Tax=Meloidogyne floridensis TaxID=298350 RepID=A0A915P4Q7_9BILA
MFIPLLFIILSLILNSYGSFEGESASFDISPFLEEASPSETKSSNQKKNIVEKHRQNFVNKKYLPLYKEDKIWSPTENDFGGCPKGEQEFEIGEIVEVNNWNKLTGGTEWLLAKIVKIKNGGYEAQVINSSLFGAQFFRCSKDIRKYSSANDTFQIDETVELKNYNEWILGKITGKEAGKYIISVVSGHRYGMIFRRYSEELRKCPKGEQEFEIDEMVEVNNWNKITGGTEWLLAKIVKIENGGYEAKIINSSLFGAKFFRCSKDIRKYSSANDKFQINETVELKNRKEWILGKITGKEAGKYIISVLSGHRYGMIFRRYSEELRKYDISKDLKHYEVGEIIEVKNFDQQTKETNWIKAKILEINQGDNYRLEVVGKCKLIGVGEQVEVCIYDKINDKTEWVKAIILEKLNGMYILGTGIYILEEYPYNIRKIISG